MNGHTPTPALLSAAEQTMQAKKYVSEMADKLGWVRLAECVQMGMPRVLAIAALAEGTLPHDDRLVTLLGKLHDGTAAVARYLDERTPQKVIVVPPNG